MFAPGPMTAVGELVEDGGHLGDFCAGLLGVIEIIQPDADELARFRNGREQLDVLQSDVLLEAGDDRRDSRAFALSIRAGLDELEREVKPTEDRSSTVSLSETMPGRAWPRVQT